MSRVGTLRAGVHRALAVAAVLTTFVGCAGESAPSPMPPAPAELPANVPFSCGGMILGLKAFSNPLGAEAANDPPAAALREYVRRRGPTVERAPEETYRVLLAGPDSVVYGAEALEVAGMRIVVSEHQGDRWVARSVGVCEPMLAVPGFHAATWHLPDGAPIPPPGTDRVTAMVSESECTSGRSAAGRIVAPVIVREPQRILVVFAVRPPVPFGPIEACPAPPPTPFDLELGDRLGQRELLDGGVWPPQPVWRPNCCG